MLHEFQKSINKSAMLLLSFMGAVSLLIGVLCAIGILPFAALWMLLGIVPTVIGLTLVVVCLHKKADTFFKKQQISVMAFQAKQAMDTFQQEYSGILINDCHIRMRYLVQNGIKVDNALKKLDGNVDAYNRLVLSFLSESEKLEDELYDLMQSDTIFEYGHKAHALHVKVNELGISKLADTAFFHEIEAYAGNLDIIRDNWKKLSFELDEAYDIFFEYINTMVPENSPGKKEVQMTCKLWRERLQEAFNALEAYDTDKAKQILSELTEYQIDTNINKTLQSIIANIDEIMAN